MFVNPKNALRFKRAGIDIRKPFVLKHLEHAMPQSRFIESVRVSFDTIKCLRVFMPAKQKFKCSFRVTYLLRIEKY